MNTIQEKDRDKQDFILLLFYLWKNMYIILITVSIFTSVTFIYSFQLKDIYTAEIILLQNDDGNNMNDIASRLSGFGAFSAFGQSRENNKTILASQILKSRQFYAKYFYNDFLLELIAAEEWNKSDNVLIFNPQIYDIDQKKWITKPSIQDSHGVFLDSMELKHSDGLYELSVKHLSPYFAKKMTDMILLNLNKSIGDKDKKKTKDTIEFLTKKSGETNLIGMKEIIAKMIEEQTKTQVLANVSEEYIFQIIDPSVISEYPSGPNRRLYIIAGIISGLFTSILFLLIFKFFYKKD